MTPSPITVFISYAKADQAKAHEIADALEQRGFRCWIAPRDVRPGRAYGDEIIRGIEGTRALILVLSSASNESGFVSREIERAVSKNKHIFTVRVEDVLPSPGLELFISSTQWIDAFSGRLGPHVDRLAQLLAEDEAADSGAPAPSAAPRPPAQRPSWHSPWLLGGGAAALLAIAGALAVYLLRAPDDTDYTVLARSCERLAGEAAIGACDRAIASRKFDGTELSGLFAARGFQRQMKADIEGALSDYREAIKRGSTNSWVFNNRGYIYSEAGDLEKALADFDRAIELDPRNTDALASRAWIRQQKGELDAARRDYEQALAASPSAELKEKIEQGLLAIDPNYGSGEGAASVESGFFGPDTRRSIDAFTGAAKLKLLADYAHVGVLAKDQTPFCNATLIGDSLALTSNYCLDGQDPQQLTFLARRADGKLVEASLTEVAPGEPLRGVSGDQRIAVAKLAAPLGNEIGWVKKLGGDPAIGDKLDIVAIDIRSGAAGPPTVKVSGAATDDLNCVVLERQAGSDTFDHRCISPEGSGGAPIFDAATGALVGIVGETDSQRRIGVAYRADEAPKLIGKLAPANEALNGTWTGSGHQTGGGHDPVSYQVVMRITASGASTDYPSLSCGGSLTALSNAGNEAQFKERITYGDCVDGGTIDVKLNGGKLDWKWSGIDDIVVTAELQSVGR